MQSSGLLGPNDIDEIFFNIQEIITIHERIGEELKQPAVSPQIKLSNVIKCFTEAVRSFSCYEDYCGNQSQQRAILKKKCTINPAFQKLQQKCESNSKLHKLTLADMLMKPMQKITRYPLLFKRLLPNLVADSPEYNELSKLLVELERTIAQVNQNVRVQEAKFRIKDIDETIDFGVVTEVFLNN